MQEEENTAVEQVSAEPSELEQTHDERQTNDQSQYQKRNDVEYNWAEARRKMQELERIAQEQQVMIQKLTSSKEDEDDDLQNLSDDDLLTVAQARKLGAREAKKIADEAIRQRENATMEDRLYSKYPDYTQVVSNEAIEYLKQNEPELASSLHALANDPYAQAVAAYKLLKRINYTGVEPMTQEKRKATENMKKPVSVNAVSKSTSPIGNAHLFENGLTPELKKSLWKEMQDAIKHA